MTDTELTIEIAKLDGWEQKGEAWTKVGRPYVRGLSMFNYLTSRDAIMPVIEKQIGTSFIYNDKAYRFVEALDFQINGKITGHSVDGLPTVYVIAPWSFMLASPRQLCVALLKATGKWKEIP